MKKYACLAVLLTAAFCHADEVEEDFPRFEGKEKVFLAAVTHHIHAYQNEDKLMMERKTVGVRAIKAPVRSGPKPLKVKMLAQAKKKFWQDPNRQNLKYNLQLTAKQAF